MTDEMKIFMLERENLLLKMQTEKDSANIDYIAMMTDVEIPEQEEETNE